MKAHNMKQLDENDEKIAYALISLGMSRSVARILSYLQHMSEATSIEIERAARLRQPEVSLAMKELKDRDWICERDEKRTGKGRPYKIYSLKISFNEIIAQLDKQHKKAIEESKSKIERLKKLGNIKRS